MFVQRRPQFLEGLVRRRLNRPFDNVHVKKQITNASKRRDIGHDELPYIESINLGISQYKPSKGKSTDGSKSMVLMIHGLFGSKQNFRSVGRKLSDLTGRYTAGIDLRNHGNSKHALPLDYMTMARDVISTLDEAKFKDSILVGHSMGAKVSMIVSLIRPDLVSKLVVIDNTPTSQALSESFSLDLQGMHDAEQQLARAKPPLHKLHESVDQVLANYESDPKVRMFLMSNLNKHSASSSLFRVPISTFMAQSFIDVVGQWPHDVDRATFTKPVLVLKAAHSNFINDSSPEHFRKYFPAFHQVTFDCGHWIVTDKPQEFVSTVVDFIDPPTSST